MCSKAVARFEEERTAELCERHQQKKEAATVLTPPTVLYACKVCGWDCRSQIGLFSHKRCHQRDPSRRRHSPERDAFFDRSFPASGSRIWKDLPMVLRAPDVTVNYFECKLKTLLFALVWWGRLVTVILGAMEIALCSMYLCKYGICAACLRYTTDDYILNRCFHVFIQSTHFSSSSEIWCV